MGARLSILLLTLLSITLGLLRLDCSPAASHHVVQVNFWNGFTGPDGRIMLEMIRQFNQANPDVSVSMQRIPWGTYYNKVMVSAIDGRGPEVFVLQSQMIPRMHRAGFLDVVNDVYGPGGELKSEFDPKLLKILDYGPGKDQLIGVPLDTWPMGLYLNREMFIKAGIVNPDGSPHPPATAEEFYRAARQLKIESNGQVEQWGFAFGMWPNNFMTLVAQFGGQLIDEQGNPTLDHPANIAALQNMTDMLRKYDLVPAPDASVSGWVGFRQQKVAMVIDGIYMLGDLKRLKDLPYMGAPVPQVGPHPCTLADSHILCIRKNLPPATRAAAARFVRFISDHSVEWANAGQVPARLSARNSDAFRAMPVQSAFAKQLPYVMYPPRTPSIVELMLHVNLAIEQSLRGNASPADALREANEDYLRYLERDRMEQRDAADRHKTVSSTREAGQ